MARKIDEIAEARASERDIYPYIRDLLVGRQFGIGLDARQVVVDSPVNGLRDAPDLAVYLKGRDGRPLRSPDHAIAVLEVKAGGVLDTTEISTKREKQKYAQTGTRVFYLIDQERVIRYDVPGFNNRQEFEWQDLKNPDILLTCFAPIRPEAATLAHVLDDFRARGEPYAYFQIDDHNRHRFIQTIRKATELIVVAITVTVDNKLQADLRQALDEVASVEAEWGPAVYDFAGETIRIEFERWTDPRQNATLGPDEVRAYQAATADLMARLRPVLYALRVEKELLPAYAAKLGLRGAPSLLKTKRGSSGKVTDSGRAIENFIYETSSLILSRMLMIRFSEDNGFLDRMISNGGVSAFAGYAAHFRLGMQSLIRESYRQARALYTGLFSPTLLDWALDHDDDRVSDSILHAMYLLNRWSFARIGGDILSGVYDQYLDTSRRRMLGEVFTRPEIARYVLAACNDQPSATLLDPACGSGTFLVERLAREIKRLREAGALTVNAVTDVLQRINGLDINPFSAALAQMQVLWHLLELFKTLGSSEVPRAVSTAAEDWSGVAA